MSSPEIFKYEMAKGKELSTISCQNEQHFFLISNSKDRSWLEPRLRPLSRASLLIPPKTRLHITLEASY
ncbi:MAG: hypothetical protein H0V82_03375 [Candidatus Protochlamydia sp.]|nr:hypothetical protein [Candidatus Protochlamydia sp.]